MNAASGLCEGAVKTNMTARRPQRHIIQRRHHEVLVRAIVNVDQAVGGLPNQFIFQQRAQLWNIARFFPTDAQIGHGRREPEII